MSKSEIIINKLIEAGINPTQATSLAADVIAISYRKTKSTKYESYEEFQAVQSDTLNYKVHQYMLKAEKSLSRQQLADRLGIKLSTICGRIADLRRLGYVAIDGTTVDKETQRTVQTLAAFDV